MEDDFTNVPFSWRRTVPHYHGDVVRTLMISGAVVMLIAEALWHVLPLSLSGTIAAVIMLAVFAGLTNPNVLWVHYVNVFLTAYGTFLFGSTALAGYQEGGFLFDPGFLANEALAVIAVIALYFATKTLRGLTQRRRLHHPAQKQKRGE